MTPEQVEKLRADFRDSLEAIFAGRDPADSYPYGWLLNDKLSPDENSVQFGPSLASVLSACSAVTGITIQEIKGEKRTQLILEARQLYYLVASGICHSKSTAHIGRFVNRTAAPVMKGVVRAEQKRCDDHEFRFLHERVLLELRR